MYAKNTIKEELKTILKMMNKKYKGKKWITETGEDDGTRYSIRVSKLDLGEAQAILAGLEIYKEDGLVTLEATYTPAHTTKSGTKLADNVNIEMNNCYMPFEGIEIFLKSIKNIKPTDMGN